MKSTRRLRSLVALSALLFAPTARADESDADRLFREGRALMLQGQFATACPKIAESNRLEPHVGTLLNLAACHERLGQVASAWVELQKALIAARTEGQADRARYASERIAVLEPRVPWLTIAPSSSAPLEGLVVMLDGAELQPIALEKAIPVDPGEHVVTATAKSRKAFVMRFELRESEHKAIALPDELPELPAVLVVEPPVAMAPPPPGPKGRNFIPAYVALFHPAATNYEQPFATTRFGLNLLYGRAGELERGLQLGTVNLIVGKEGVASGNMSGVQFAPLFGFNYASGHASGIQAAFLGNVAGGGVEGGQVSLGVNVSAGDVDGAQIGVFGFNFASGHARGVQGALLGNAAGGGVEGGQVSFGANVSAGDVDGAQLALGANVATRRVRGIQFGSVNVAGDVSGAQVGFINVAKKVDGVALGILNVADDIDGVPIGLASVTRSGGVHPTFWSSTASYANAGVKFATKHTYTMVAAHYTNLDGADYAANSSHRAIHLESRDFVGGGFFLGGHVPIERAFIDFDVGFSGLTAPASSVYVQSDGTSRRSHDLLLEPRVRVMGGYALAKHASLFGGVGILARGRLVNHEADAVVRVLPELLGGVQF